MEMAQKTFWSAIIVFLLATGSLAGRDESTYSSEALQYAVSDVEEKVYQLQQLRNLRRPVPPRRIQLLDWKSYSGSGHFYRKGILFTYRDLKAKHVFLAGDFSGWNRLIMERNRHGVFYVMIPVREMEEGERASVYRYRFNVDGLWTHDPLQYSEEDGTGGMVSVFHLDQEPPDRLAGPRILPEKRTGDLRLVEFAVHESRLLSRARLERIENVSIVGDFNHWNPESDLLRRGADGVYRLRMRLLPGQYMYRIVVDGRWILDPFNESVSYHAGLKESYSKLNVE
ncbi:glycoside hydrolase family 13 domain protein [Leptonema illini DSM 21528]|uniref:Glycoside hydrolase family 13 domain protein n=2 Tax=Leptonema illini TaxID=183 RepID=H2CFV0_9LEPT|nr:glycoside hydrolase family 13 domain protein [Leptonema illini DSM 21528]